jgi:hypothetical protein
VNKKSRPAKKGCNAARIDQIDPKNLPCSGSNFRLGSQKMRAPMSGQPERQLPKNPGREDAP